MKLKKILLGTVGGVVGLAAIAVGYGLWGPLPIHPTIERQTFAQILDSPELMTQLGFIDGTFVDFHSGELDEIKLEDQERFKKDLARYITEIKGFTGLTGQQALSQQVMLEFYETQLAQLDFPWAVPGGGLYPVDQLFSPPVSLPQFLSNAHVVKDVKSAERYISRLNAVSKKFEQLGNSVRAQRAAGVVPPDFVIDKSLLVLDNFTKGPVAENPLVTTFKDRLEKAGVDDAERARLIAEATKAVETGVYPAYQTLAKLMREEIRPKANSDAGVWRLPDGARFYKLALRANTTVDIEPDVIHDIGLSEVARISGEMDVLLKSLGHDDGTVGERIQALDKDPAQHYPPGRDSYDQELADLKRMTDTVMAKAPEWFNKLPKQPLDIQAVPEYAEATSPGGYYNGPALDGSRPGIFFINLGEKSRAPKFSLPTLVYHEAVPGHHFQIALAQTIEEVPTFRKVYPFTSYAEGWALYAERLAKEMGMYENDPYGDLGRLRDELFRAVRLVVDTGIHAKRWTREQAIAYMRDTTGMNEGAVTIEIDRYIVLPGQACAYKLGQLKILDLRDKAKAALGDKFDIKGFHDVILGSGGLPLTVLEAQVDAWVKGVK
ncbi:DUF885 domain-containing protein [Niveispirillum sp. KHB5.9]|uniref:DUF885 domain-containing protein n=1 Tax=Niveispirillum sp. KHB5.9 TaxID=3400269 RepID=UPI003A898E55